MLSVVVKAYMLVAITLLKTEARIKIEVRATY